MPEYLPTILIIAVLAVICFIAVLSIIKRANKGCCGAGGGDIEERIEKDTSGFTHRYSVKIGGMHCEKCSSRIAAAFNRQDGVYAEALVLSKDPLPELVIRKTIMGLDYTVEAISEEH